MGQKEHAELRLEREPEDTCAERKHQHRRRPVDRIAGADLTASRLQKCSVRSASSVVPARSIEKMLPIATLTSMFDDPSSGSKTSRYLAFPPSEPTETGASISSETIAATRPLVSLARTKMSFATTSSGCCRSPCELNVEAGSGCPAERTGAHRLGDLPAGGRYIENNGTQLARGVAMALSLRGEEPRKCHPIVDHGVPPISRRIVIVSTSSVLRFDTGQIAPGPRSRRRCHGAAGTRRRTTTQVLDGRERETRPPADQGGFPQRPGGRSISPSVDSIRSAPWKS